MNIVKGDGHKAFVTGATGAVGTALVRNLLKEGWEVHALHRPTSDTKTLRELGAYLVEGDISEPEGIKKIPKDTDVFFHLAASLSLWSRNNNAQMHINVKGTQYAVNAALEAGVGRFIHTSTVSAYGRHDQPITETTTSVAEQSFICYERSKWLAEIEVHKGIKAGLNAVIINPCAILGPGFVEGWASLLPKIKEKSLKAVPPGILVVNHIDEVVNAHISAVNNGVSGQNYILSGEEVSIKELVVKAGEIMGVEYEPMVLNPWVLTVIARMYEVVSMLTGKEPVLSPEMVAIMSQKLTCGTDKACRILNYKETSWKTALQEMYLWLRDNKKI